MSKRAISVKLYLVFSLIAFCLVSISGDSKADNGDSKGDSLLHGSPERKGAVPADASLYTVVQGDSVMAAGSLAADEMTSCIIQIKEMPLSGRIRHLLKNNKNKKDAAYFKELKRYDEASRHFHSLLRHDMEAMGLKYPVHGKATIKRAYRYAFYGMSVRLPRAIIGEVEKLSYIQAVYQDREVRVDLTESVPLIKADAVWNLGYTGAGIVVGILDAGIDYTHPDLGGGFGPGYKVAGGYDFVNDDPDPMDDYAHGTHVAGIVAANGVLKGVAPDACLMAYKVLNAAGVGYYSDIIAAVERACDPDQDASTDDALDIINLSFGAPDGNPDDPLCQAIDNASAAGVVCVAAAGNNAGYFCIHSPGCARTAITVGASTDLDAVAPFSSKGPDKAFCIKPDLVAPGAGINSTVLQHAYGEKSGTSMAAPHVAGVAALVKQKHPDWTPSMIKSALMGSAHDINKDAFAVGTGRIDAAAAVTVATIVTPPSISAGFDDGTLPVFTKSVQLAFTNTGNVLQTYSLSTLPFPLPPGITVSVTPATLTVPPGETQSALFSLSVDNAVVPDAPAPSGSYQGALIAQSGAERMRIPFAFVKSAYLDLRFDVNPSVVVIHNRIDKVWTFQAPGTALLALVPKGTYDVIAHFNGPVEQSVVRENMATQTATIINAGDARYAVTLRPVDENGSPVSANLGFGKLVHAGSKIGLSVAGPKMNKKFSAISDAYRWEWVLSAGNLTKDYLFTGYSDGFSHDTVLQNGPSDLIRFRYRYHMPRDAERIFVQHFISSVPFYSSGYAFGSNTVPALGGPFITEAFYMPLPYDSFSFGYSYNQVYADSGAPQNIQSMTLLKSPYLAVKNDGTIENHLFGSKGVPILKTTARLVHVNCGPEYWFGRFDNTENTIGLRASQGTFTWLYLTQNGDVVPHDSVPFELHQDGALVTQGVLRKIGTSAKVAIPDIVPGSYTLIVPDHPYHLGDTVGAASVRASFHLASTDKNPPYINSFKIVSQGDIAAIVTPDSESEVRFEVYDNVQVNTVSLYRKTGTDWVPMPLARTGNEYVAPIPALPDAYVSLKIVADDPTGNTVNCIMEPAFYIDNRVETVSLNPIGDKTIREGELLEFIVTANTPGGENLHFDAENLPPNAWFHHDTRIFSFHPDLSQAGVYGNIRFSVTDGLFTAYEDITITVRENGPPELHPIGNKSVHADETVQFTVRATDPDNDTLAYSAYNLPVHALFDPLSGVFQWTPDSDEVGTHPCIRFDVNDGVLMDYEEITITVYPENRPPVLNPIGNRTVNENEVLAFTVTASDPDGDTLTFTVNNLPPGAAFDSVTGHFSWKPDYTQAGVYGPVGFTVSDGEKTAYEDIAIQVNNVNLPPAADAGPDQSALMVRSTHTVSFDGGNSSAPDGAIKEYRWSFGDGTIGYGATVSHQFTHSGTHHVVLKITDDNDATAYDTCIVTLTPTLHVGYITVSIVNSRWYYWAYGYVAVVDNKGYRVSGVTVKVHWSGAVYGSDSAVSDNAGIGRFVSDYDFKPVQPFTLTVDSLVKAGYAYYPQANEETSDSAYPYHW